MFSEIAAVYEVTGKEFFRKRAYENAAANIEHTATALYDLWEQGKLDAVPGLGEKFRDYLDELFQTGEIQHFVRMRRKIPAGVFALLPVQGVGPKKALQLARAFDLQSPETALDEVVRFAKGQEIQKLDGFGPESEQKILEAIQRYHEQPAEVKRMLLPQAEVLANEVITYLKQHPAVEEASPLGSLRRRAATIGDVDIAVRTQDPLAVMDHLRHFPHILKILSSGETTTMFVHTSGKQVDVKTEPPASWGSLLQHYTGSKGHNILLRQRAQRLGLSISEHGVKNEKTGEISPKENEEAVYQAVDLPWIPPELREGNVELERAAKGKLPQLIETADIKGDFHVHTNIDIATSHDVGSSSVGDFLALAISKGYQYLGFSDHNPRVSKLDMTERRRYVQRRRQQIEEQVAKYQHDFPDQPVPQIYIGLEIDIQSDGKLALESEIIDELDYAIVSIHSNFDQDRRTATKRVLAALSHPKVRILGHPTGRKIHKRLGLEYDWEQILRYAQEHNKWIEVNASPIRLDLPDELIPQVHEAGVRLVIDTDSHHAEHMHFMPYGVAMARRGWAEAQDVVNTFSAKELAALMRKEA